jgi:hypothetical protein
LSRFVLPEVVVEKPIKGVSIPKPESPSSKESFLGIPLKGWAAFAISLIAVCATLVHYSIRIYGDWQEQKMKTEQLAKEKDKTVKEKDMIDSVNQITSANTNLITQELQRHKTDQSGHQFQIHSDNGGVTVATYFESDGCIAIARPGLKLPYLGHPGDNVELSLGPSYKSQINSSLPLPSSISMERHNLQPPSGRLKQSFPTTTSQDGKDIRRTVKRKPRLLKVQAGCLNPHPWTFQSWWGPANGCLAPQYRRWNDGCTHYQLYNSCNGQWDPRIFWTYCNPNHHQ